jgi:hypothetical protein
VTGAVILVDVKHDFQAAKIGGCLNQALKEPLD